MFIKPKRTPGASVIVGIASHGLKMAGEKEKRMNAEKILTWSVAALGHLKQGANGNAAEILEYLKTEAEAEIRHTAAKQSGNGNRQKAAERVIKSAMQDSRPELRGSWNDSNGAQYICDGFRLLKLIELLPLEKIPEDVQPIDAARIIPTDKNARGAVLELPSIAELKAYIKEEKARKKAIKDKSAPVYDFGAELPAVNAQYLLDMLEVFPGCTARATAERPKLRGIYFESVHGCGVLLPVRKAEE